MMRTVHLASIKREPQKTYRIRDFYILLIYHVVTINYKENISWWVFIMTNRSELE